MIETVNLTRVDDRWIKTVKYDDEFRFDDRAYNKYFVMSLVQNTYQTCIK